ncbi:MAG: hypothetical protein KDK70_05140 [Myxococcales bacterium]|nr:hypothetical protein [Myxococcales bacterium]
MHPTTPVLPLVMDPVSESALSCDVGAPLASLAALLLVLVVWPESGVGM